MRASSLEMSMGYSLLVVLALLASVLPQATAGVDWQWRSGRATNYGAPGDPWSIMTGSCGYGYLDPTIGTGWDIAAMVDVEPDYAGSCGRCYEVSCDPRYITDGYGESLDRSNVCYDSSASVIVMITDTCPCYYPSNAYSNKRWCCGDTFHLDISTWAFEKMADTKWGVMAIKYREVPCSYRPDKPATLPSGKQPSPQPAAVPGGWQPSWDKRPNTAGITPLSPFSSFSAFSDGSSASASATSSASGWFGSNSSSSSASASVSASGASASASATSSSSSSWSDSNSGGSSSSIPAVANIFYGGLLTGWTESSFNWQPWSQQDSSGPSGDAHCGSVNSDSGTTFKGGQGWFSGKTTLDFMVKKVDGGIPDFTVKLMAGAKGDCRTFRLNGMSPIWQGDWIQFKVYLGSFSWDQGWQSSPVTFNGCSSSIGAWDVNEIEFKNAGTGKWLCVDYLKVY